MKWVTVSHFLDSILQSISVSTVVVDRL
ncbi:hypothetical protein SEVIR_1G128202v4 [Setaria viridis]